ncbi:cysteine proteinase [Acephala macrosclerotiorum]|nr:cysteine proteinase [Acephala macrosclerotiorum]
MTSLKRKAEEQLTRSTAEEPTQETDNMHWHQATLSAARNIPYTFYHLVRSGLSSIFSTSSEMVHEGTGASPDNNVLPVYESATYPTTEKRVRRHNSTRSKSVVDRGRKEGRGRIDVTRFKDEEEARKGIDDFWAPPAFGSSKPKGRSTKPLPSTDSSPEPEQSSQKRRYSDPSPSPAASSSSSASPEYASYQRGFASKSSMGRAPATPESLPRSEVRATKGGLADALESLFLDGKEPGLRPSESKEKERERVREQRRIEQERAVIQARKDRRLHRQYPLRALVEPLDARWDARVKQVQKRSGHETITTSLEGTELRLKDFNTLLAHRSWLNDEIINTYIEWVVAAANEAAAEEAKAFGEKSTTVPKFIAHNSFFYTNLRNKGPSSTDRLMKRKKAPGASLMEVDSVFVPICQGSHWTIGVVRPIAKTIEYFDSMGGTPTEFIRQMRGWLKHQLGSKYKEEEWTTPRTACAIQTNGYDCGVFVCTNAFCVALGIDTSCYEERDMTQQRRCIAAILLNRGFTKDFEWGKGGLLPAA